MKQLKQQFGGKMTKALENRYALSPQWKKGKFENLEKTTMDFTLSDLPGLMYKQFVQTKGRTPEKPIPVIPFDQQAFLAETKEPQFIWYGHSVLLMRWSGKTILIDPMLGSNASPIAPFKTKRFSNNTLDLIDDFPTIDLVLMTHDHYDHLDYASILKLKSKTKQWFVALGIGRHLESWGIESESIREFDWWEGQEFYDLNITFTPSRHFSGRGTNDRAKSLWGGWAFERNNYKVYWSGDGGYGDHFKTIGEKFGSFDWGFMECGQYHKNWHKIHMYPEEAVAAAHDVGAKHVTPVHWAGFALSLHTWKHPVEQFTSEAKRTDLPFSVPAIGELFNANTPANNWWETLI